ncbi:MAG: site-specific integrase [Desulfobacterales bacterium]|nr:MAG: site-specific integrase [Desulfobacterales bacterium]
MGALRKIVNTSGKVSWQIDYIDPAGKRVRQTFKKRKLAEAELGKRVAMIAENTYQSFLDQKKAYTTTFGELIEAYKGNYQDQSSYLSSKRFFVENFKAYFKPETLLSYIRYVDLETYRNHLKQQPTHHDKVRTVASINREMSCLRHMCAKAFEWEMVEANPFEKGKSLHLKENNRRDRFLSEEEIDKLLDACCERAVIKFGQNPGNQSKRAGTPQNPYYLRDIVECALNTGMRRGEILSLKWNQIKNGFIYLAETKTKEPRQIPINDDLAELFSRIRKEQHLTSEYVFTYQNKRIDSLRTSFNAAVKRAGIDNFRFHDLRHTFASQLLLKGGTLKDVQELLGHKTMTMTLRYAHLTQEHKRKAVNLLNGLTGRGSDKPKFKPMSDFVRF